MHNSCCMAEDRILVICPASIFISQMGMSACGCTAIKNVLLTLQYIGCLENIPTDSVLLSMVSTRLRNYDTKSVLEYLISRAKAGTTHLDLIHSLQSIYCNVRCKFFTFDSRGNCNAIAIESFRKWIVYWLSRKCVPIITLNLFVIGNDALHHQTIYGIDEEYVLLTNPVERIHITNLYRFISTPGFMIIPEDHISSRPITTADIEYFSCTEPWKQFNVSEQLIHIHEKHIIQSQPVIQDMHRVMKNHSYYSGLTIPWGGITGITLCYMSEDTHQEMDKYHYYETSTYMPIYDTYADVINMPLVSVC